MNAPRSTFIRDQLEEHVDALAVGLTSALIGVSTRGATLTNRDAAAGQLIDKLIDELRAGLPLCDHLSTRIRPVWTPGLGVLGCMVDFTAHAAVTRTDMTCDLCGGTQRTGPHAGRITGAMVAAGPVAVYGYLCADCRLRRAARPHDVLAVRRVLVDLVEDAYWHVATGGGPDAA